MHPVDLGQTLGRWGLESGAYILWPVFGPSTLRDSAGLPLEIMTPGLLVQSAVGAGALSLAHEVDARGNLLGMSRLIDDVALDKYRFVRDGCLARRRSLVCDCDLLPPDTTMDDADLDQAKGGADAPKH